MRIKAITMGFSVFTIFFFMENEYITILYHFNNFGCTQYSVLAEVQQQMSANFKLLICAMKANMHIQMSRKGKKTALGHSSKGLP